CAGRGSLPKHLLSQWLSQDRLYAQTYLRFIGQLLSKIRLPSRNPDSSKPSAQTVLHRAVDVLIDALVNIRRELGFFESVAEEFGLDLTAVSPEDGMVLYTEEMGAGNGNPGGAGTESANNKSGCPLKGSEIDCPSTAAGACCGTTKTGFPGTTAGRGDPEKGCTIFFGPNRTTRAYIDLFMSAGSPG
ncbi:TENA/THI-4/PQQC family, partial [Aspergillus sclerotialis]